MSPQLELEIDAKSLLGEGPCWDADEELLYWVDIMGKKIHIYNPTNQMNETIEVEQHVTSVVKRESGGLLLTTESGIYSFDKEKHNIELLVDPESELTNNRFNDGKCDPAGRFWAGTMDFGGEKPSGSLYRLDTNLQIKKIRDNVMISNGIAWSPNYETMYYVDSPTKRLVAFDYNIKTGEIKNERVFVTIPENEGVPDGITTDMDGHIWIAQWGGSRVSRWNGLTGKLLDTINVPASQVTSCAFGGKDMNELYITTARDGLSERDLLNEPLAGGVFRLNTNVRGMPSFIFKG